MDRLPKSIQTPRRIRAVIVVDKNKNSALQRALHQFSCLRDCFVDKLLRLRELSSFFVVEAHKAGFQAGEEMKQLFLILSLRVISIP